MLFALISDRPRHPKSGELDGGEQLVIEERITTLLGAERLEVLHADLERVRRLAVSS